MALPKIILIPQVPPGMAVDVLFRSTKGIIVQATEEEIQLLKSKGVAVATLYASGNEYSGALYNKSMNEAVSMIHSAEDTAVASLAPGERNQFPVA